MRVDYLGLEAFVSIGDRGSFHRAAAHLNLSQTALSHRMKKLEDNLGVRLLTRTTRHVSLTPAGVELLPKARRIIDDLNGSFEELRLKGAVRQERLAIACLPTLAIHYLPRILACFRERHARVVIRIHDNSAAEISHLVETGQVEFGLTIVSAQGGALDIEPLAKEAFFIACPADHPLSSRPLVSLNDLDNIPLVRISPHTGNRMLIDDALGARREQMDWRYEVQHVASAMSLVEAGLALAIVPRLAINATAMPGIVMLGLRGAGITRTLGLLSRRGTPLSPLAAELKAMISAQLREEARRPAN